MDVSQPGFLGIGTKVPLVKLSETTPNCTHKVNISAIWRDTLRICVLLAQWITWLTRDRCNPKVPSSIPAGGKDFP